jgi:DNA-binding CsgD family transcriptional regulator
MTQNPTRTETNPAEGFVSMLCVVSSIAYIAALFLTFISSSNFNSTLLIVFLCAILASCLALLLCSRRIGETLLFILTIIFGLSANASYYLLANILDGEFLFYLFSGLSIGTICPINIKLLCRYWTTEVRKMTSTCLILSITFILSAFLLFQSAMIHIAQFTFCVLSICMVVEINVIRSSERRNLKDTGFETRVTWRARVAMAVMSLAGMYVGIYLLSTNEFKAIILAMMAFIFAAGLVLLDSLYKTGYSEESRLSKITAPLMTSLLLFIFVDGTGKAICCFVVLFCFAANIILSMSSTIIRINKAEMNYIWPTSNAGILSVIGAIIGATMGIFNFQYLTSDNTYSVLVTVVFFVCIVIWFFTLFARNEYPVDSNGIEGDSPKKQIGRSFAIACNHLSERYSLSQRKKEVLIQLARGRGSKHISETLCISQTTAKTHIYQIYKALGVNSREELIDLVETEARKFR